MPKIKPFYYDIFYVLILVGMAYSYHYFDVLNSPPNGLHNWRQSDGASIAYMYYSDDDSFFEPKMHNLLAEDGKAVSEFPILYYIVSLGYEVFGFQHWVFRGFWLLITLTGIFFLYKFCNKVLKDNIWSILIASITFTSPVFIVYGISYLPDTAALSFLFIGWYFIYRYIEKPFFKNLFFATFFVCLAGLLKVTILIPIVAFGIVVTMLLLVKRIRHEITSLQFYKRVMPFFIVGVIIILWYYYAKWYNEYHFSFIFLLSIKPYWELTTEQLMAVNNNVKIWKRDYFHPDAINVLYVLSALVLLPLFSNKLGRFFYWLLIFSFTGVFIYIILFYAQFQDHDYYTISILFLVPLVFLFFVKKYTFVLQKYKFTDVLLKLGAAVLLVISISYASNRVEKRFAIQDKWLNTDLYELRNKLHDYGISKSDIFIAPHDPSPNITLYALDVRGWTAVNQIAEPEILNRSIEMGAKYFIITDENYYNMPIIQPYKNNLVVDYKGIRIYSIK